MKRPKLGALGTYPQGKLNPDDEGALRVAVGHDDQNKVVLIDFGKKVKWLGLDKAAALNFAAAILSHAQALKGDVQ